MPLKQHHQPVHSHLNYYISILRGEGEEGEVKEVGQGMEGGKRRNEGVQGEKKK